MSSEWRVLARRLLEERGREEAILDSLIDFIYPIEGLSYQDIEVLLKTILDTPTLHSPSTVIKWSQLVHTLITVQRTTLNSDLSYRLFTLLLSIVPQCDDPTEPLYGLSILIRYAELTPKVAEKLLVQGSPLVYYITSSKCIPVQRAGLDCVISLCQYVDMSPLVLNEFLEVSLQLLNLSIIKSSLEPLPIKFQLSCLRTMSQMLSQMGSIQPLPQLPSLLATLKVVMTTGLPGHRIPQTLLPLTPHPDVVAVNNSYQVPSVAGPRQKRQRRKLHTKRDHTPLTNIPAGESDGDSSEGGQCRRSKRGDSHRNSFVSSGSESDLSDSDITAVNLKELNLRLRLQSLICLSAIFQSLDRHFAFSYGLPFLPDAPRPPSSPPSLLTCLCKDPSHKCRSAASTVLVAILEGSKSFLAVANDQPVPARPFTPYSTVLGGVVKELHRTLLLAVTAEPHSLTLTHIVKCLSVLASNTTYHQLTGQYISRIVATLQPIATHPDTDVAVGSLTCYGALLSLSSPHCEVEVWLKDGASDGWPWIVQHCATLVQSPLTSQSLVMEAVQVLTAIVKFHFHIVQSTWQRLSELYFNVMTGFEEPLQLHALRFLEELGRTLSIQLENDKELIPAALSYWERLLSGPLTLWLQRGHTHPTSCSQSCSVLATMGNIIVGQLKQHMRILVQTLILGLSKDENASIKSGAMRTLGVFSPYSSLSDDTIFLVDCSECIKDGLSLKEQLTVRTQASWAVGNLSDSLVHDSSREEVILLLYPSLASCVVSSLNDIEKVKINAVRAAGNLLRVLNDEVFGRCGGHVIDMCSSLAGSVNNGSMKTRWNACYACHNAFSNSTFLKYCSREMIPIVEELCVAVVTCKNFKVRTNAALALGSPTFYPSPQLLQNVWIALLKGLENSHYQPDFTEYQQTNTLRHQLCLTVCKLISGMEDVSIIGTHPLSPMATKLLKQTIQEYPIDQLSEDKISSDKWTVIEKAIKKLEYLQQRDTTEQTVVTQFLSVLQLGEENKQNK